MHFWKWRGPAGVVLLAAILLVGLYISSFMYFLNVGHLNFLESGPGIPITGYYFSDNGRLNRAACILYWPLTKAYEAYQPGSIFLPVSPWSEEYQTRARDLFGVAMGGSGVPLERRITAASELAKLEEAGPWVVLVLLGGPSLKDPQGEFLTPQFLEVEENRQRPLVASVLRNLTPQASDAVLWAVTTKLADKQGAIYGISKPLLPLVPWLKEHQTHTTDPIRDLALAALKRALKVDYGYDAEAWRQYILSRGNAIP